MRVAIMGAGSLGTVIGALIAKCGVDIELVDTNHEHVAALNEKGATIVGTLELNVPVRAITPAGMSGIYDLVLYIVKQTANADALNQLLPHLGSASTVCTLQNGVPEDAVAAVVGQERTVGCTVGWGASWVGPGVSRLTSEPARMSFDLGELDGVTRERTRAVAALLQRVARTEIVPNLAGIRWTKLLINAAFSGMSTVLGCTFGEILDHEKAFACAAHIGNETIGIAKARGIRLEPLQGHDMTTLGFATPAEMMAKLDLYRALIGPHRMLTASMLQDIQKGRKTEIDAINGVVSHWGRKLGIPTPFSDKVVEIVQGIEAGRHHYGFHHLDEFVVPGIDRAPQLHCAHASIGPGDRATRVVSGSAARPTGWQKS